MQSESAGLPQGQETDGIFSSRIWERKALYILVYRFMSIEFIVAIAAE
jgi:hypothetical protein